MKILWGFTTETAEAAVDAFCGGTGFSDWERAFLRCREGRANVVLCAWGDEEDDLPQFNGYEDYKRIGLLLDSGHHDVRIRDICLHDFRIGIEVYRGEHDVFYGLRFDETISQHGIHVGLPAVEFENWKDFVVNEQNVGKIVGLSSCLRSYPTAAGTCPREVLIGFCTFDGVGSVELSNGSASVGLGICATKVCIDHCLFVNCIDGVTSQGCSTGHLIFCNLFKDMILCAPNA